MSAGLRERARELREAGGSQRAIAAELGVSITTVRRYTNPEYERQALFYAREAKRRRTGVCVDCGATTRYNGQCTNGPSQRCLPCSNARNRIWTAETIVDAIQRWAAEHGRPPTADDWRKAAPDGSHPAASSCYRSANKGAPFDSWSDAIRAAGFDTPAGGYVRTPEIRARMSAAQRRRWARARANDSRPGRDVESRQTNGGVS